ncbi:MAG: carbohydrate ABC transporter permease [Chloroflexota bacterium]|nr:carbohydrate ABC transporter permease [Chloroflexota bacterium]
MAQFNEAGEYLTRQQAGAAPVVRQGRDRLRANLRTGLTYVILTIFLVIAIGPLLIIALAAFKTSEEIAGNIFGLPAVWSLANFAEAWSQARFDAYFRSSVIVVVPVVIVSCFLSILTGYAFGQMRFAGSAVLFPLFLIGIMVPGEAVIIPIYYNLRQMNLIDTYWAMILPDIAFSVSFGTLWMRGFFSTVPRELVDAATVDGSTSWQTLWRILVPNAIPAVLTMGILFFIWTWNDFLLPLVVVSRDDLRTLPLGLTFFQGRYSSDLPLLAAGATMVALPTIVVYVLMQRHFIRGLTSGAVK